MKNINGILILMLAVGASSALSADFPALQSIFSFFGGDLIGSRKDIAHMTLDELGRSRGQCYRARFEDYVLQRDRHQCAPDDHFIAHLLPSPFAEGTRKPPIMVKCLQPEPAANVSAGHSSSQLLMMASVKEIVALLKPIGNATKRHEPGSCVLVLFFTETSLGCAHVAPYANMLPHLFPTLRVAAIDAFEFPSFNTEFGIVGLPTLLLFHQGRPIVKFYSDVGTFAAFVTRHTGIKPIEQVPTAEELLSAGAPMLPLQPVPKPDVILVLAWSFILLCLGNYFAKSRLCQQIIEMIKRNWRESEAQLEHN